MLDEPLNGLDPLVRAETIALFRTWGKQGLHVIISSHILHEVDLISDQVVLLSNGYVVAEGKIQDVRGEMTRSIRCRSSSAAANRGRLAARLFSEDHVTEVRMHDDRHGLLVSTRDPEQLLSTARGHGAQGRDHARIGGAGG